MNASFWKQRWQDNRITFHKNEVNPLLVEHFGALLLSEGARVFLPLCGKTRDIGWLLSKGYRVAGAELSELAVKQLFEELGTNPSVASSETVKRYSAQNIDIFVGDIFDLSGEMLGTVDAVYDRAALVALPETMRESYTKHLRNLTSTAPQLMICYEYDQSLREGPPFSVDFEELERHYKDAYDPALLSSETVSTDLGNHRATQNVWLLKKR